MTQYNTLHLRLSNSELNKLKSGITNGTEVLELLRFLKDMKFLKLSSNVVPDSNDENNFSHKLSLTNTQISKLRKAFGNDSSANIKLSKTILHKIGQSGGCLDRLSRPSLKPGLPLMKSVLNNSSINNRCRYSLENFWTGTTTLIISNEEMNAIMKIVKSPEESALLIKGASETIQNEAKERKGKIFSMLLGTLGVSLLGNLLAGKTTIRAGESAIRVGQDF